MYRSRMTDGRGNERLTDRNGAPSVSTTSALSASTRQVARRDETTESGS